MAMNRGLLDDQANNRTRKGLCIKDGVTERSV